VSRAERPLPLDALKEDTAAAVLRGPGTTPPALRQALARGEPPEELRALVEKIRRHAYKVTDEDFAALRARYSEDELFEIVVASVIGAADDRLRAGLRALEDA
jgi:hypothetical protein